MITTIFWLLFAHAIADYSLQTVPMGKYKNPKNVPTPPPDAKPVSVWQANLLAHGMIHAGCAALVVGPMIGAVIGVIHTVQDFIKTRTQYSPNVDQLIHIVILIIIGALL